MKNKLLLIMLTGLIALAFVQNTSANCFIVTPAKTDYLLISDINPDGGRSAVLLEGNTSDTVIKGYSSNQNYDIEDFGSGTCANVRETLTGESKMMIDVAYFQGKLYNFFVGSEIKAPGLKSIVLSSLTDQWFIKYIPYSFNDSLSWDTIFSDKTDITTIIPKMSRDRLTVMSLFFAIKDYQEGLIATYK